MEKKRSILATQSQQMVLPLLYEHGGMINIDIILVLHLYSSTPATPTYKNWNW